MVTRRTILFSYAAATIGTLDSTSLHTQLHLYCDICRNPDAWFMRLLESFGCLCRIQVGEVGEMGGGVEGVRGTSFDEIQLDYLRGDR